jgi:hypothetical protein
MELCGRLTMAIASLHGPGGADLEPVIVDANSTPKLEYYSAINRNEKLQHE